MVRIVEIKEDITDTKLIDNIYDIQKVIKRIAYEFEINSQLNIDDYNYLNVIFEKTKINLEKVYNLIKRP